MPNVKKKYNNEKCSLVEYVKYTSEKFRNAIP